MNTLSGLLIAYAFFGCIYWLWMAVAALRVARTVPVLETADVPEPAQWPRLSVVIPACNEAETLGDAVATLRRQDYPRLEIVLVNDRSTDATGRLIDQLAGADRHIRGIHILQLPEAWLGKVNALARGTERTSGNWILYTDADVHFAPGTLRRAVAFAEHHGFDHLTALPEVARESLVIDMVMCSFLRLFTIGLRCWAIGEPASGAVAGIGAFNLVRREALSKTPGFTWLRLEAADDMGLALMLKHAGLRAGFVNGVGLVSLRWYRTLDEMARGGEKSFATLGNCRVLPMLIVAMGLVALEWAPLAVLVPVGFRGMAWSGLFMGSAAVFSATVLCRWTRRRVLPALLFPLTSLVSAAVLLRAAWLGVVRGGVYWRGTHYPSRLLRQGSRIHRWFRREK